MSWIKIETHTFDKTEIYEISQSLSIDPDAVVGKCARIWSWFDVNTTDGVTKSVTKSLLDRYCGVTGFCDSMISCGWMIENDGYLYLPNYDRHNSATAKSRALGSKRQHKHRSNADSNANALPKSSGREEKRREEEIHTPEKIKSTKTKNETFIPDDFSISENVRIWASKNHYHQLEIHLDHFIDACKAKGYKYSDWDAAFRNAIKANWAKIQNPTSTPDMTKEEKTHAWMMKMNGIAT